MKPKTETQSDAGPVPANTGFTLIELLVVVAIIAILAGMLLPVLSKAKAKAQGIQCLNNLKHMQLSCLMYADDNNDRVPPNGGGGQSYSGLYDANKNWVRGWMTYAASSSDNTNTEFLMTSHLWKYHASLGVWKCPGDKSTSKHGGKMYPRIRSVTMNGYISGDGWDPTPYRVFWKISDFVKPSPSEAFVFADTNPRSIRSGFFGFQDVGIDPLQPASLEWVIYPASHHDLAGTLAFADGHVELHRWRDSRSTPPGNTELPVSTPSRNNQDLIWLLQHTTAKK